MLNVHHPDILPEIVQMAVGIRAYVRENESILVIKASARVLLAAKSRKLLKIYFAPIICENVESVCMLTAFPDNHQNPLLIWTPLFFEESTNNIIQALSSENVNIYFVDEKNRPWLSYSAININSKKFRSFAKKLKFPSIDHARSYHAEIISQATSWFRLSGLRDDRRAFNIILKDTLSPDDIAIIDLRGTANDFYGSSMRHSELEYKDAGGRQEPDVAEELAVLFGGDNIFLNPLKIPNMEELCDTLVVGQQANYFFQLKSSPNTEKIHEREFRQTRNAIIQHVKKAVQQTRDCIEYLINGISFEISLKIDRKFRAFIPQKCRNMIFIIVTHEAIFDDLGFYAEPIIELAENQKKVICHLSESALYQYLHYSENEDDFFNLILGDFGYLLDKRRIYDQRFSVKLRIEEKRNIAAG